MVSRKQLTLSSVLSRINVDRRFQQTWEPPLETARPSGKPVSQDWLHHNEESRVVNNCSGHHASVWLAAIAMVVAYSQPAFAAGDGPKFYADDPLLREPAPRPIGKVAVRTVDDIYDFVENSFITPGREGKQAKTTPARALDINTLGEVPDNAWYTNRHAKLRMSIAELQRGPGNSTPPSPNDSWIVIGAKSDGVTPGFVIEDKNKNRYLLKLDPPRYPELSSAADVIGSKFFYALGYSTPENYIVHFRAENLELPEGATWKDASGRKHALTKAVLDDLLRPQPKGLDGAYRALASRWLPGKTIGPFSYRGTRSDDPNDTIPHEDRRVLRGLAVFSAWLNHHDTRSINSLDTLVEEGGRQYIKHNLIDFGSILGSAGVGPKEAWTGHQYTISNRDAAIQMVTLSLYPPRWMRADYPNLRGVGLFDSASFVPQEWKPNYPNPAFLMMDSEDAFWAAKQVANFTDEEIRAIVSTGEYSDQRSADWIAQCLMERRDKIIGAWISKTISLDRFRVESGKLVYDDLYAAPQDRTYNIRWSNYDNDRGTLQQLPDATGATVPTTSGGKYLAATIACDGDASGACSKSLIVYLRRTSDDFEVVGIDR